VAAAARVNTAGETFLWLTELGEARTWQRLKNSVEAWTSSSGAAGNSAEQGQLDGVRWMLGSQRNQRWWRGAVLLTGQGADAAKWQRGGGIEVDAGDGLRERKMKAGSWLQTLRSSGWTTHEGTKMLVSSVDA